MDVFEHVLEDLGWASNLHIDVAYKHAKELDVVWYNHRIAICPSPIQNASIFVDLRVTPYSFCVAEPADLLPISLSKAVRSMSMSHELGDEVGIVGVRWHLRGHSEIDIGWRDAIELKLYEDVSMG